MDKSNNWVKVTPDKDTEESKFPLTIHDDFAEGKSFDDGYHSGFIEGHEAAVKRSPETEDTAKVLGDLPTWLACRPDEWKLLMKKLDAEYVEKQKRWNWTYTWLDLKELMDQLLQNGKLRGGHPLNHKAAHALFLFKSDPKTVEQFKAAFKAQPALKPKRREKIRKAIGEVFFPGSIRSLLR